MQFKGLMCVIMQKFVEISQIIETWIAATHFEATVTACLPSEHSRYSTSWESFNSTGACLEHMGHGIPDRVIKSFGNYYNYSARSYSFAEYWIHFMARLDGVHAFGYNSAESEPIWMKFGTLWVHCLSLAPAGFGRASHKSESQRTKRNFVFFVR